MGNSLEERGAGHGRKQRHRRGDRAGAGGPWHVSLNEVLIRPTQQVG